MTGVCFKLGIANIPAKVNRLHPGFDAIADESKTRTEWSRSVSVAVLLLPHLS
jgi:hypothetical protein